MEQRPLRRNPSLRSLRSRRLPLTPPKRQRRLAGLRAARTKTWAARALILSLSAFAATACSIEWDAPERDLSEWVTSNRYIEYSHEAERGMALTLAAVLVVFGFTLIAWTMNRRMGGPPVLDGRPWPLLVTSGVVGVLVVAFLVAALS